VSSADVAKKGVELAMSELKARGADVIRETSTRAANYLRVTAGAGPPKRVYVKTRRTGDWQTDTRKGRPRASEEDPGEFWLFVDLAAEPPQFFIAPAWWVENDLYEDYQAYIARHGGRRAVNPTSTHQRITRDRITEWHERWDLLGLK